MRILHILNTSQYSGAENVAITIINNMRHMDNTEFYYVSKDGPIRNVLESNNIQFIPIEKISIKEIRRICKLYKPDIIHAHDFTASVFSIFAGMKTKMISHLHNNPLWIKKININSIAYLFASTRHKRILLVSNAIKNEYIFKKHIAKKIRIIGNPVDCNKVLEQANLELYNKKYDIAFLGRLSEQKDPLRFINIVYKATQYLPSIKVAIIGDGILKEECNKKIKELNLQDTIDMLGFLDNPYPVLKNSKLLCMTSKWEGYGLVIIEALTLGKPVVATGVGGIPTILDNSCGKICNTDNDFIAEILKLSNDKEYYENKSKNTKNKLNKVNNMEKYIENLKEIYCEIIK